MTKTKTLVAITFLFLTVFPSNSSAESLASDEFKKDFLKHSCEMVPFDRPNYTFDVDKCAYIPKPSPYIPKPFPKPECSERSELKIPSLIPLTPIAPIRQGFEVA